MKTTKRHQLEARGWKIGSVSDFLELSNEEIDYIELKLQLADRLKEARNQHGLTQKELATKLNTSQSRVAKMETGDHSVSLDLLIKSLLALGVTNDDIGKTIANTHSHVA